MEAGFSPGGNSCLYSHSFWEVVNSGQEMSWHFGLGVITLLSLSGVGKSWVKTLSKGKASVVLAVGSETRPGYVELGLE